MLSRNAESLFWTSRYMQRADNLARHLEVGYRMSMIPAQSGGYASEWNSILTATNTIDQFSQRYADESEENVAQFLIYDGSHPSSIASCLRIARDNARQVRTAITSEVWLAINQMYLAFREFENNPASRLELPELCDWVKRQASMVRGAFINTQLHNDGSNFFSLGYFVERADNTARALDIKYHILLPTTEVVGGGIDNYQWSTLLRALGAYRSFHWEYGGDHTPAKVAEFLILNRRCPRSLSHCVRQTAKQLDKLCSSYQKYSPAQTHALHMLDDISSTSVDQIISSGLHEYLRDFIVENNHLAERIGESFLFGER